MADSKSERQAIDAAAIIMAEEESRLGITHAGFAMTSLPHKRIEEPLWRREGHKTTLLIESGRDRLGGLTGVPYGSIARLILLYLQTEATRTNNPEVELGRSMKSWMGRMNLTTGGKTYQLVTEQARRISACRLTFFTAREGGAESRHNGAFVQDAITFANTIDDEHQPALWQDKVRLDPGFWQSLREHPVPVREEAIMAPRMPAAPLVEARSSSLIRPPSPAGHGLKRSMLASTRTGPLAPPPKGRRCATARYFMVACTTAPKVLAPSTS
jgi:hypothetical protein